MGVAVVSTWRLDFQFAHTRENRHDISRAWFLLFLRIFILFGDSLVTLATIFMGWLMGLVRFFLGFS